MKQVEGRHPNPVTNLIFEKAMEAVYGEDVWDWVNKQFKE